VVPGGSAATFHCTRCTMPLAPAMAVADAAAGTDASPAREPEGPVADGMEAVIEPPADIRVEPKPGITTAPLTAPLVPPATGSRVLPCRVPPPPLLQPQLAAPAPGAGAVARDLLLTMPPSKVVTSGCCCGRGGNCCSRGTARAAPCAATATPAAAAAGSAATAAGDVADVAGASAASPPSCTTLAARTAFSGESAGALEAG